MHRIPKPVESEPTSSAAPAPQKKAGGMILRIEQLEPRVTPQSLTPILE